MPHETRDTDVGQTAKDRKHRLKHRFEVLRRLGQGTYGKVQLAVNKETGQEVAIKTIKKSKIESEQDLVRIRREIQIMSSIQHPHIIHIYEVFENKEKIVLVMQYASGGELYDYLSEKKALQDVDARRIFRQIAAAVYYCHKSKICHRDLKLENVLLDERGNAKIADFGLSNVYDENHLLGTFCGSPLYASPEIVKGTPYYGPEVDCWSLGVLLYTLVYGAMPFDGSNFRRLVRQISEGDYFEPKKKSEASGLIRKLLTVSPAKRATIIDICTDWWVNVGFEHSLLQVAEDMINLTPVRFDLLLSLSPTSPTKLPQGKPPPHRGESSKKYNDTTNMLSKKPVNICNGIISEMKPVETRTSDAVFNENYDGTEEFLSADEAVALADINQSMEQIVPKINSDEISGDNILKSSNIVHKMKKTGKSDSVLKKHETFEVQTADKVSEASDDVNLQMQKNTDPVPEASEVSILGSELSQNVDVPLSDHVQTIKQSVCDSQSPTTETADFDSEAKAALLTIVPPSPKEKKKKKKVTSTKKVVSKKSTKDLGEITVDKQDANANSADGDSKYSLDNSVGQSLSKNAQELSPVNDVPVHSLPVEKEIIPTVSVEVNDADPIPSDINKETSQSPSQAFKDTTCQPTGGQNSSPLDVAGTSEKSQTHHIDNGLSMKKLEDPKLSDKPKSTDKPPTSGVRRPGKLVIPRFLESPQTTSSPKSFEVKKIFIPGMSVSDAKKSFETKNKASLVSSKPSDTRKKVEASVSDVRQEESNASNKGGIHDMSNNDKAIIDNNQVTQVTDNLMLTGNSQIVAKDSQVIGEDSQTVAANNQMVATEKHAVSSENQAVPSDSEAVPSESQTVPSEKQAIPSESHVVPSKIQAVPSESHAISSGNQPIQSECQRVPSEIQAVPCESHVVPSESQAVPSESHSDTSKSQINSSDSCTDPTNNPEILAENHALVINKEDTDKQCSLSNNHDSLVNVKRVTCVTDPKLIEPTKLFEKEEEKCSSHTIVLLNKKSSPKKNDGESIDTEKVLPVSTVKECSIAQNPSHSGSLVSKAGSLLSRTSTDTNTIVSEGASTNSIDTLEGTSNNDPIETESPAVKTEKSIWDIPLSPSVENNVNSLSASVESDMDSWRQEMEATLKRLSPEGASEKSTGSSKPLVTESNGMVPAPITRSYKKFTFNKDGTYTTETGKIYAQPDINGTWTKVEKSTKVTSQPRYVTMSEPFRSYREFSPLHHSDSQSSSGSNDVIDDIFDTWTGDRALGNLMKRNSAFDGLQSESVRRQGRLRESMRKPKTERKAEHSWARSERRPGHLTDRDSSDNEDEFDFRFDSSNPANTESPNMVNFMRSMNKDFKDYLRYFKERHMPSYSRAVGLDRLGIVDQMPTIRNDRRFMTRSVSKDSPLSPTEKSATLFSTNSPTKRTSVRDTPRAYDFDGSRLTRHKYNLDTDVLGRDIMDIGSASDFPVSTKNSGSYFNRTSIYGTMRPKAAQRYKRPITTETTSSTSTPQLNSVGSELSNKCQLDFSPENHRKRIESWLQMSLSESDEKGLNTYSRLKPYLHDLPENKNQHPDLTLANTRCDPSNCDADCIPQPAIVSNLEDLTTVNQATEPDATNCEQLLKTTELRENTNKDMQTSVSPENSVGITPTNFSRTCPVYPSSSTIDRTLNSIPHQVVASPADIFKNEPNVSGSNSNRGYISTNSKPGEDLPSVSSVWTSGTSDGIWNNRSTCTYSSYNNGSESSSLLEALKMRGYRNVISQRFLQEQTPRELKLEDSIPNSYNETHSDQEVKACSLDTLSNACSLESNPEDTSKEVQSNCDTPFCDILKKNSEEEVLSDTVIPDSLDAYKHSLADYIPKNYEEESVSERIRRKSYFIRFNDDRPTRRSTYRDNDFIPDYRSGLWSRFSVDNDTNGVTRRTSRGRNNVSEKHYSANLEDYLDDYSSKRKDSSSSFNQEDFLSDDGLWGTYGGGSSKSRFNNGHAANFDSVWNDRPGSLWTQRGRQKTEQSVLDTVPDLAQRRWTSRNSYCSSVPAKSPVQRRGSLHEGGESALSEEGDSKSRDSEESPRTTDPDSDEIANSETDLLNHFTQD